MGNIGTLAQPYDFGTGRKTKRFFCEDYINLTKAATDKTYVVREAKKEEERDMPHLLQKLSKSAKAYRKYFNKLKGIDDLNPQGDENRRKMDPLELVRPESPTWRVLKKEHKQPEMIKNMIETNLVREIPETTNAQRRLNFIVIPHEIDKRKVLKEYRQLLKQHEDNSSDSEYEQKNLKMMLAKKKDKGIASMGVLEQVNKRLAQPKTQMTKQYGQRSQHMQTRDHENRLIELVF